MPFPPEDVVFENVTVTGEVRIGDYPDGAYLRLADVAGPRVIFASGDPNEDTLGFVNEDVIGIGGGQLVLDISTGQMSGGDRGRISLRSESDDTTLPSTVILDAATLRVTSGAGQIAQTATGPVGTIVRKLEIRNTSGTVLGYVPVYDTIT